MARAEARLLHGDPRGTIEDATVALKMEPRSSKAYCLRALAHLRIGDRSSALADARAGTARDPARSAIDDRTSALAALLA